MSIRITNAGGSLIGGIVTARLGNGEIILGRVISMEQTRDLASMSTRTRIEIIDDQLLPNAEIDYIYVTNKITTGEVKKASRFDLIKENERKTDK